MRKKFFRECAGIPRVCLVVFLFIVGFAGWTKGVDKVKKDIKVDVTKKPPVVSASGDIVTRRDVDLNGTKITFDPDKDTYAAAIDADDSLSVYVGGTEYVNLVGTAPISARVDRITIEKPVVFEWNHSLEDFTWRAGVYATVWDVTNVVGTGTNVAKTAAGVGGAVILTTGATTDDWECTQTLGAYYSRLISVFIDVDITIDTDLVGKEITVGLSDNPLVEDGDYAIFEYDYSVDADHWWMRSGDGTDATTSVDAAVGEVTLSMYLDTSGNAYYWIDDVYIASIEDAVTADTAMILFVGVKTEADQAEVIDIRKIYLAWK